MNLCPYCQARPLSRAVNGQPPVTCGDARCRHARQRERNTSHHRVQSARRMAERRASPDFGRPLRESPEEIARLFALAKAARLARERATGQRTFTIESGWMQKPQPVEREWS